MNELTQAILSWNVATVVNVAVVGVTAFLLVVVRMLDGQLALVTQDTELQAATRALHTIVVPAMVAVCLIALARLVLSANLLG